MSKQELWGVDISDAAWLNLCPSNVRPFDCMPPPYSEVTVCIHICPDTHAVMWKESVHKTLCIPVKEKNTTLHHSIACTVSSNNLNYSFSIWHFLYSFSIFSIWLYSLLHHFGGILAHYSVQRCSSLRFADIVPKSELWLGQCNTWPNFSFSIFLLQIAAVILDRCPVVWLNFGLAVAVGQTEDRAPLHHCA